MSESVQKAAESTTPKQERAGKFRLSLESVRSTLSGQRTKERAPLSYPLGLFAIGLCTLLLNAADYTPPIQPNIEPAIAQARLADEDFHEPPVTLPHSPDSSYSPNSFNSSSQEMLDAPPMIQQSRALKEAVAVSYEFMDKVERSQVDSAIIVHFGANDKLLGYQLINEETGEISAPIPFFARHTEALEKAQAEAKKSGVPQVANFTLIDNTFFKSVLDRIKVTPNTPESPWVTEKPADVLTPEELASNGITILNPSGDATQLHLRKNILEDGFLKPLMDLRELDPKYTVVIIPVDAPYISWEVIDSTQKEELLVHANDFGPEMEASLRNYDRLHKHNLDAIKNTYANQMRQNLEALKRRYQMAQTDEERQKALFAIHMAAENNLLVQSLSTAELALSDFRNYQTDDVFIDNYPTGLHYDDVGAKQNFVFISMGDAGANMGKRIFFWAQPDGSLKTSYLYPSLSMNGGVSNIPRPDQSFQTVDDYTVNPYATQEDEYRFGRQDSAQIMRHELAHAALITWVPKLHELYSEVPDYRYPWLEELAAAADIEYPDVPNRSEYLTDTMTIGSLNQAEKWLTEHGSDKGYSFVFEIPPNTHTPDTTYSISQKAKDTFDAVAADAAKSLSRFEGT